MCVNQGKGKQWMSQMMIYHRYNISLWAAKPAATSPYNYYHHHPWTKLLVPEHIPIWVDQPVLSDFESHPEYVSKLPVTLG